MGVDPGKTGAYAFLTSNGEPVGLYDWEGPQVLAEVVKAFGPFHGAFIEKVGSMPGQGVHSVFTFGYEAGAIYGSLAALGVPVTMVSTAWKRRMGLTSNKDESVQRARDLFPSLLGMLKRAKDHNRAEALLIAEYGRRFLVLGERNG